MRLSVRARVGIALVAVGIGATYGWLTTPHHDPDRYGVTVDRFQVDAPGIDGPLEQIALSTKDSGDGLLVFLHGRGSSPDETLSDELFAALEDLGASAPVVLLPNGGESSYWHDRSTGPWATYLIEEVIPRAIERTQVNEDRLAIGGISMGGFGAISLALDMPGRFCGVGGHSPAIFRSWEDAAGGAFDDESDFDRHDVLERADDGDVNLPIWIDAGEDDPFLETSEELARTLEEAGAEVTLTTPPGAHDDAYWRGRMDDYLGFYADALRRC